MTTQVCGHGYEKGYCPKCGVAGPIACTATETLYADCLERQLAKVTAERDEAMAEAARYCESMEGWKDCAKTCAEKLAKARELWMAHRRNGMDLSPTYGLDAYFNAKRGSHD